MSFFRFLLHGSVAVLLGLGASAAPDLGENAAPPVPGSTAPDVAGNSAADVDVEQLRADLARLISTRGEWSVLAVSLDRGDVLFGHAAGTPRVPASNMKLVTTAAALHYLGPDFRYTTFLATNGTVRNSVLEGDLVIYGTGDPTISDRFYDDDTAVLSMLADTLAARGIRSIRGDIVGDASYFASPSIGSGWKERYRSASYAAPASALSFHDNVVSLQIRPADSIGWRPRIDYIPAGEGIALVNRAVTTAGGRTTITAERSAYDGPIVVSGRIARGASAIWRAIPVADPARYTSAAFRAVLEEHEIQIAGNIRVIHDAEESLISGRSSFAPGFDEGATVTVLASHTSPPLLDILTVVNQRSHNLYAEQVLRTVGRISTGDGSLEGASLASRTFVQEELGASTEHFEQHDGSGLSANNRVSPELMVKLLEYMATSPQWQYYRATLPIAGETRGLLRMRQTAAAGNLRAKTGTIDSVSALSGYVEARNGEVIGFSIMSNEVPSTWAAKRIEDRIGQRLAEFHRPPPSRPELPGVEPADRIASDVDTAGSADGAEEGVERATGARPSSHTIRSGDTLEGIAKEFGVSVQELEAANPGLDPRRLIPGRTVQIPGSPVPDDAAARPAPAREPDRTYTIRKGDTLDGIARRHGIRVQALQDANPGLDPRRLIPGRTIKLPQ